MDANRRAQLEAAYLATRYRVQLPDASADIRIGEVEPQLERWLQRTGEREWAFVSACNPGSVALAATENAARHLALQRRVQRERRTVLEAQGIPDSSAWQAEPGLLIAGIAVADASRLAQAFGQLAIVVGRHGSPARLLWLDER